jgi:hypothetical protein
MTLDIYVLLRNISLIGGPIPGTANARRQQTYAAAAAVLQYVFY